MPAIGDAAVSGPSPNNLFARIGVASRFGDIVKNPWRERRRDCARIGRRMNVADRERYPTGCEDLSLVPTPDDNVDRGSVSDIPDKDGRRFEI
jgi:hypothetical protein